MENILTTIVAVALTLGTAWVLTLIHWPGGIRVTYLRILFLTAIVVLAMSMFFFFGTNYSAPSHPISPFDILLACALVVTIIGGGTSLVILAVTFVMAMVMVPTVNAAIRNGVIKVRPQVVFQRKITKAIIDHARAITRMNLPLAEGFFLSGLQTPGRSGVVMQAMATFLHQGLKLSEAYGRYKARSALVLSMLEVGERSGQLPGVLEYLQDYFSRMQKQRRQWEPVWWPYLVLLLTVMLSVFMFVLVVVIPKFETIFRDYGTTMPKVTLVVIRAANMVSGNGAVFFGLAVAVAVGVILWLQPRRYPEPRLYSRIADRVVWLIPGWREKYKYADLAHAAAVLGLGLGSGMTMVEAVKCVADLDLNTVMRRRFREFYEMILRSEPPDQAGQKVHLPPRFLWALRSGQDLETIRASLGLIERYYSLVASHWFLAVNSLVWPLIVIMMGTLVCIFELACFLPLVKLIEANAAR